ncbi:MAG: hypothetical protein ACFB6R_05470 [Alphaproteobacteria bacterium]
MENGRVVLMSLAIAAGLCTNAAVADESLCDVLPEPAEYMLVPTATSYDAAPPEGLESCSKTFLLPNGIEALSASVIRYSAEDIAVYRGMFESGDLPEGMSVVSSEGPHLRASDGSEILFTESLVVTISMPSDDPSGNVSRYAQLLK